MSNIVDLVSLKHSHSYADIELSMIKNLFFQKENNSKLFVCFLDVQKAFDSVWHNGLFVKSYEMGIRSNLLCLIMKMYKAMKSAVLYKGYYSAWFSVL